MNEPLKENESSIFVVEDDIELSAVIDRILLNINPKLNLDWATSTELAIRKIEKKTKMSSGNPYELIILDIFLDGARSGVDFWKYCHSRFPTMKILIMSSIEYEELISLLNVKDQSPLFLKKPFRIEHCSNFLKKLLLHDSKFIEEENI